MEPSGLPDAARMEEHFRKFGARQGALTQPDCREWSHGLDFPELPSHQR